jgi:hypothetical protein
MTPPRTTAGTRTDLPARLTAEAGLTLSLSLT